MDSVPGQVAGFILAGGKSTRMGREKAFLEFEGHTLLDRALSAAKSVTSEVWIVGSGSKFAAYAPVVEDLFPNCGPLGGIHAALRASSREVNLILAVDLPFVSEELLRFLIARSQAGTASVTLPRTSDGWQPLCAIYRRSFVDAAEAALRAGRYKIDALFGSVEVQAIAEDELVGAGFSKSIFSNLNTRSDVELAREDRRNADYINPSPHSG